MPRSSGALALCLMVGLAGCDATDDDEKRRTVVLPARAPTAEAGMPAQGGGGGLPAVNRVPPAGGERPLTDAGFDVAPVARDASLETRDAGAPLSNPFADPFLDGGLLTPPSFDDAAAPGAGRIPGAPSSGSVGAPPESDPALIPNTGGSLE